MNKYNKILKCILLVSSRFLDLINAQKTENINTLSGYSRPILGRISFTFAVHCNVLYCTLRDSGEDARFFNVKADGTFSTK